MTSTPQNIYSSAEASSPAICIPRVFANITERRIAAIFEKLDLGELVRIDMVLRENETGDEFYRVFVHIAWGESQNATATRAKLQQPNGEVKVVYDDPWFWKLRASNSKGRRVRVERPEPFIDFSTVSTTTSSSHSGGLDKSYVMGRTISAGDPTSGGPVAGEAYTNIAVVATKANETKIASAIVADATHLASLNG